MIEHILAFIGLVSITVCLVLSLALWWHNRMQRRMMKEATEFLKVVERTTLFSQTPAKNGAAKTQQAPREGHA